MTKISKDIIANSGVVINQDKSLYSFNLDTILLYNFAKPVKKGIIVDLCSGNGAIGLTLTTKTTGKIYLVELQKQLSDLAQLSIEENHLQDQVTALNVDIKKVQEYISHDTVDTIVCNPPYFVQSDTTKIKDNPVLAVARHELKTDLNEVLKTSMQLLKENSHLYMVYRPDRLPELFEKMIINKFQPKKIRFVRTRQNSNANLVLVDAIKTVHRSSLEILPDLITYDGERLTQEAEKIING